MVNLVRSRWSAIGAAVAVTLGGGGLIGVSAADTSSTLVPIAPVRVLDTRASDMVGDITDGSSITVQITGSIATASEGTKTVVPSGASAITGNMTLVSTTSNDFGGYATIYPCGARPDASNINFTSGQTVANSVAVPLSVSGTVCIYVYGTAHVLLDVSGYYTKSEIADLAERVTQLDVLAELEDCDWFERLSRTDGALKCVASSEYSIAADAAGKKILLESDGFGGYFSRIDGKWFEFSPLTGAIASSRLGSLMYTSTDCSGSFYVGSVADEHQFTSFDLPPAGAWEDEVWPRTAVNPETGELRLFKLLESSARSGSLMRSFRSNYSGNVGNCVSDSDPSFPNLTTVYQVVWGDLSPSAKYIPPFTRESGPPSLERPIGGCSVRARAEVRC